MRSTFHSLETAKRSLFTQNAALQTTGHNIANANTAGYSRQVVNMTAARPIEAVGLSHSAVPGQLGTGVEFTSITRIREKFLDDQFRNENKAYGNYTIQADTLEKLETIFSEPSDSGLATVLDNFWKSWSKLAIDPSDYTGRKLVRENGLALTNTLNQMSTQLTNLNIDLTENVKVKVDEINTTITTIANLNHQIVRIEGLGDNANDLRDQRDLLTDQLSKIMNINVQDASTGYTITMGGMTLVNGNAVTEVTNDSLNAAFSSGDLNNGEVFAMIRSRDVYVADYQKQLDTLARALATGNIDITVPKGSVLPEGTELDVIKADGTTEKVTFTGASRTIVSDMKVRVKGLNGLHKLGYLASSPLESGGDFFASKDGSPILAGNIGVSNAIIDSPSKIATIWRTYTDTITGNEVPVLGNNDLAVVISQLNDTKIDFSSIGLGNVKQNATLNDYYRSVLGQLGVQTLEAQRQRDNQKIITEQVDERRNSVSGVSMDEEMSNLIKYQHAYNAAARVMTTVDEMLDRIINGMGVVGR